MSKVIVDEIQTDTSNGNVRIIPNGTGKLEIKGAGGDDAMLQLNCSAQSHGVKIKSPAHSVSQEYTMILPDNNIAADKYLKVKSIASGSGTSAVGQLEFADAGGGVTSDSNQNTIAGTGAGANFGAYAVENTLFGYNAGAAITSGDRNVLLGDRCGAALTTGYENIAIGASCLRDGQASERNIAIGKLVMESATTVEYNVGIGYFALRDITTGDHNIGIGYDAGGSLTTGSNNTLIGYNSGQSQSPSGAISTGSNNVVLGDNNVSNLYCADTSISSSDSRDKTDVTSFTIGLNWIEALRPVTYRWDRRTWYGTEEEPYGTPDGSKKRQRLHLGFLAQEALAVEQANGYGTNNDDSLILNLTDDGMSYGMKYERLVPILVNAIKELSTRVKTLEGG